MSLRYLISVLLSLPLAVFAQQPDPELVQQFLKMIPTGQSLVQGGMKRQQFPGVTTIYGKMGQYDTSGRYVQLFDITLQTNRAGRPELAQLGFQQSPPLTENFYEYRGDTALTKITSYFTYSSGIRKSYVEAYDPVTLRLDSVLNFDIMGNLNPSSRVFRRGQSIDTLMSFNNVSGFEPISFRFKDATGRVVKDSFNLSSSFAPTVSRVYYRADGKISHSIYTSGTNYDSTSFVETQDTLYIKTYFRNVQYQGDSTIIKYSPVLDLVEVLHNSADQNFLRLLYSSDRRTYGAASLWKAITFRQYDQIHSKEWNFNFYANGWLDSSINEREYFTLYPPRNIRNYRHIRNHIKYSLSPLSADKALESRSFSLFPNPATGQIIIRGLEKQSAFTIRSVAGQVVLAGIASPQEPVNISSLSPGLYTFTVEDGQQSKHLKLVKQ